ncbi:MAG: c-type cytochrome [Rhodocyclaceae bacterium]|nr:c-type cytochrome [Rhodocyclaceae bacterium]MBX3670227.1 c-type cytochrome [Rhodocyclaceae bacterium]
MYKRKFVPLALGLMLAAAGVAAQAAPKAPAGGYGVGRPATEAEVKAWDIDVRPDFKGLPNGSGTVSRGQDVWEARCASCHGTFAESNEVFTPLVGGTTPDDSKTGHTKALATGTVPQRTTIMKVGTVSTLFDYINRAMPWNSPKSLSTDEVYSVLAYLLNLAEIIPENFVLSDKTIAEVQQRMPNRNGMTTAHGMWDIKAKPDVQGSSCMKDCPVSAEVTSRLPEFARNAHGNIAEQNRPIGPVRGADTTKPPTANAAGAAAAPAVMPTPAEPASPAAGLVGKHNCTACHAKANKVVGPSWDQVAAKYKGAEGAEDKLVAKVKAGGSGVWGAIPMPAHAQVPDAELRQMVQFVLNGAK